MNKHKQPNFALISLCCCITFDSQKLFLYYHQHFIVHIFSYCLHYPDPFFPLPPQIKYSLTAGRHCIPVKVLIHTHILLCSSRLYGKATALVVWNAEHFPTPMAKNGFGHVAGEGFAAQRAAQVSNLPISNIWHWKELWMWIGKYLAVRYSEVQCVKTALGKSPALTTAFG